MNASSLFLFERIKKAALQAIVFFWLIIVLLINLRPFLSQEQALLDFGSFYASGLQLRSGQNPYSPDSKFVLDINYRQLGAGGKMVNLNPPISAMIFGLISQFDPYQSFRIWQVISAVLFTGVAFFLTAVYSHNATPARFVWAFAVAGIWQTLILGQVYVFLFLFAGLGWVFLKREKHLLAGVLIGLVVAFKPHFMIWPIFLLVSGYSASFLAAAFTGLLISLIPLFVHGIEIYEQWLGTASLQRAGLILPGNSSLLGLTARFDAIALGIMISAAGVCILLYLSRSRRSAALAPAEYVSALGIMAALLASPISWVGYTLLLLPLVFSLKNWNYLVIIGAAILAFPFELILRLWHLSFSHFVIFGWMYGWGLLFVLAGLIKDTVRTGNWGG